MELKDKSVEELKAMGFDLYNQREELAVYVNNFHNVGNKIQTINELVRQKQAEAKS